MHNKLVLIDWNGVIESRNSNEQDYIKCFINVLRHFNVKTSYKDLINSYNELYINNNHIETITEKEYLEDWLKELQNKYNFTCTIEEFIKVYIKEFSNIDYYQNVIEFIHSLKGIVNIGIFANLSILDLKRLDLQVNLDIFDYKFLSIETKLRKTNIEAYKYIEENTNIKENDILLIDSSLENIEKAKELGWNTCYASGHELNKIILKVYEFLDIKNDSLLVEKLDHFGRGVVHIDGKTAFIENALPTELIDIEITKENKNFLEGINTCTHKESIHRIKPICPKYYECGGCQLQHLLFEKENKYKKEKVIELLTKFTSINKNVVEDTTYTDEYNYRNKITLHGSNNKLGYHKTKTNDLIEINECPLVSNKINNIIKMISNEKHNIKELTIRTDNDEEKIMIKIKGEYPNINKLQNMVDVLIINNKLITKEENIISNIGNKKFYLSIDSFFQVNKTLTEKLYNEVKEIVKKSKPNKILDLYCGTGTIGIYVSDYTNEVIGIDYSKSGIKNANQNKTLNNINNIKFICNKVENVIDSFTNDIDLIIVDPPRAGLDKNTIKNIKRINPKEIIYVSCDPATLVRDLNLLDEEYKVEFIKPYNMFPRTYHVENVCYLTKRKYQTLEGENIILRKAKEDDLDSIWKNVWVDKSIADNMLWEITTTLEDAKLRLKRTINYQKINYAYFVCLKNTNEPIGFAGIKEIDDNIYEDADICIATKYQRKGYGKEVVKLLQKLIFEELKGERFIYGAFSSNENSKKVCKSQGFKYLNSTNIIREHDNKEFVIEHFYYDKDMYK